jgi:hypothetical protein
MTMQQRAQETLRQLCEVFPDFEEWWKVAEFHLEKMGLMNGVFYQRRHHRVMQEAPGDLAIGLAKQSPSMATSRTLSQPAFLNTRVR